jgi:hypothetical protein
LRDLAGELRRVALDRLQGRVVALLARELEELLRVAQPAVECGQAADDRVEMLLFPAELLGALRIVPDLGILERLGDRIEAGLLRREVKDTSAARPRGARGRRGDWRWR